MGGVKLLVGCASIGRILGSRPFTNPCTSFRPALCLPISCRLSNTFCSPQESDVGSSCMERMLHSGLPVLASHRIRTHRRFVPVAVLRREEGDFASVCEREVSKAKLIGLAKVGRVAAKSPESRKKHSEKQRRHEAAKRAWRSAPRPAWPDEKNLRTRYTASPVVRYHLCSVFDPRHLRVLCSRHPRRPTPPASTALAGAGGTGASCLRWLKSASVAPFTCFSFDIHRLAQIYSARQSS